LTANSFVMDAKGELAFRAPAYAEGLYPVQFERHGTELRPVPGEIAPELAIEASVYEALVLGVRDYVNKHGFPGRGRGTVGWRGFRLDAGDRGGRAWVPSGCRRS